MLSEELRAESGGPGGAGRRRELAAFVPEKARVCGREGHAGMAGLLRQRVASMPFCSVVVLHHCSASVHTSSV